MAADGLGARAARMERAAGRDVDRARRLAFDHVPGELCLVQTRGGLEQGGGVGVARVTEHRLAVSLLDDPAEVHDRHAVREVAHDGKVVGDEDDREAEAGAQVLEQAQDRRLDRDVEGRDRLVGDDDTRGSTASALAMAMRWRCPPENWLGRPSRASPDSPTRSMSSLQRSSRFPASTRRWTRSSSRSTWRTLMRGLSDEYGSWKTIWMARRSSALRLGPSSRPSKRTVPAVGTNWPTMHLATVVLPHPDSPTSPSTSPRSTLRLTSPTACSRFPCSTPKATDRPSTSMSALDGPALTPAAAPAVLAPPDADSATARHVLQGGQKFGVEAGRPPAGANRLEGYLGRDAFGRGQFATGMEGAAARQLERVGE